MTPEQRAQVRALEDLHLLATQRRAMIEQIERKVYHSVQKARSKGLTWRQIAEALGMVLSNAYDRYHEREVIDEHANIPVGDQA